MALVNDSKAILDVVKRELRKGAEKNLHEYYKMLLEEGRPCHWKESTRKFYSGWFNTSPRRKES